MAQRLLSTGSMCWRIAVTLGLAVALGSAAEARAASGVTVGVVAGRMTVKAQQAPLCEVLDAIARRTGAAIDGLDEGCRARISADFSGVPLAEAMRRVLGGRSFTMRVTDRGGEERLLGLSLAGATRPQSTAAPVPAPESRLQRVGELASSGRERDVYTALEQALASDPDVAVRRAALHGLLARGLLDVDLVERTAAYDEDAALREEAKSALAVVGQ